MTSENQVEGSDVLVLGAGISGLLAAERMSRNGESVTVVDAFEHVGGNHRSWNHAEASFDIGAIFFRYDSELFNTFPFLRDICVPAPSRMQKLTENAGVLTYPFDARSELHNMPVSKKVRAFIDIVVCRLTIRNPRNALDFLHSRIGKAATEDSGISHYIIRMFESCQCK